MTDSVKIPLFKKADLDASIGVFFDGFSKVIVAVAILLGTFGLDGATVFGTMMPGVLVNVIVLNGGLWLYYRHVAKSRGDRDLTAIPAGLQAGRMFIWLYSIMLPVYNTTGDAVKFDLSTILPVSKVEEVKLNEDFVSDVDFKDGKLSGELGPHKIITYKFMA